MYHEVTDKTKLMLATYNIEKYFEVKRKKEKTNKQDKHNGAQYQ